MHEHAANLDPALATDVRAVAQQVRDRLTLIATDGHGETTPEAKALARQSFRQLIPEIDAIRNALRTAGYSEEKIAEFQVPRSVASARLVLLRLDALVTEIVDAHSPHGTESPTKSR